MRTHRLPVCSNVAPARSALAISAADNAAGPSSSATTIAHSTMASRPKPAARSFAGAAVARPRTSTSARTRRSGPIRSITEAGELGRRLLEEQVGPFDVELDGRRFRGIGELGQHVDDLADLAGGVDDGLRQRVEVILVAGELDGERRCLPHVVGAAPPAGIELVDDLDGDLPRVERVVGDDEAQTGQDDRLAERPAVVAVEARRRARPPPPDAARSARARSGRGWPGP